MTVQQFADCITKANSNALDSETIVALLDDKSTAARKRHRESLI